MSSTFVTLQKSYALEDADFNAQVSDAHLDDFSRCCSSDWKFLCSHLKLDKIVVDDIDCRPLSPKQKRRRFFSEWKQRKGSDATYKVLVQALLEIDRRKDAEYLCELLKNSLTASASDIVTTAPTTAISSDSSNSMPAIEGISWGGRKVLCIGGVFEKVTALMHYF